MTLYKARAPDLGVERETSKPYRQAKTLFIAKLSQSPNLSKAWDELVLVSIAPATHPPTPIYELFNLQVQAFALVW